jgi:hypothetical protein
MEVEVTYVDGQLEYTQELMDAMWGQVQLQAFPVNGTFAFEYQNEHHGVVDLLCYLEMVNEELRNQGPEKIIEAVLELINSAYMGDDEFMLVGKVIDLYAVELNGHAGLVFRTIVLDGKKPLEEMLMLREVAKNLFPVPQPE